MGPESWVLGPSGNSLPLDRLNFLWGDDGLLSSDWFHTAGLRASVVPVKTRPDWETQMSCLVLDGTQLSAFLFELREALPYI